MLNLTLNQGSTRCAILASAEAEPGYMKNIRHLAEHQMSKPNYIETRYIFDFDTCSYKWKTKVTVCMVSFLHERIQNWTEFTWLYTCKIIVK